MEIVTYEELYEGLSYVEEVIWKMLHGKCYMKVLVIRNMLYG